MRSVLLLATMFVVGGLVFSCSGNEVPSGEATFVGRATCAKCHDQQHQQWVGSHHDLAMQEATDATVLGDFDDAEFTHHGVTSRFSRRGEKFIVRTEGPDGDLQDYEVAYVFGVHPLQQYMIRFPRGRMQVLSLCWDARSDAQGGQRWYHLYGDEKIPHGDELHWTGPNQTWNYMCASCHSTGLEKGYDLASDSYNTTWFEIDVSCEACHGTGSHHVAWAEAGGIATDTDKGLAVLLKSSAVWKFDEGAVTARREPPLPTHTQAESCAPCHSRRSVVSDEPFHGRPLLDTHRVSLLDELLYHADGQILDEVYVYGSFAQSKMYHAGVTCSDCHEPHSLTLRAQGNALCLQCHLPTPFDTRQHHMHEPGSAGASCVACHMPERTYMGVDPRRDHSIRIPRPDLSLKLGTPNACKGCHQDKSSQWAAEAIRDHFGADHQLAPHYAETISAGRTGRLGASKALAMLAIDTERPAIVRATAVDLLGRDPRRSTLTAIQTALGDPSPMIRTSALSTLDNFPQRVVAQLATALLSDPVRAVRIEAARVLAAISVDQLPAVLRPHLMGVLDEYIAAQMVNADQPWAHVNLGLLYNQLGRHSDAEQAYRHALRIRPDWTPTYVNLADFYRQQGRDDEGETLLRQGLREATQATEIHSALGLLLARNQRMDEALEELGLAARQRSDVPRFAYTYAVALHSNKQVDRAMEVLRLAQVQHPRDWDLLTALATFNRDRGAISKAIVWARLLVERDPEDTAAAGLLEALQQQR